MALAYIMQGAADILRGTARNLNVGRNHNSGINQEFLQNIWEWNSPPLLFLLRNGLLIWLLCNVLEVLLKSSPLYLGILLSISISESPNYAT